MKKHLLLPVLAGSLLLALWSWRHWRPAAIDAATMARHLDRTAAELEESSELALAGADDLPLLARLQRQRVSAQVDRLARVIERTGGNAAGLLVKREQKLSIPVATLVVIL